MTTKILHTPAPWGFEYEQHERYGDGTISAGDSMLAQVSGSNYGVYLSSHGDVWDLEASEKEHMANGRLMQKSPELFEQLVKILGMVKATIPGDHFKEAEDLIAYITTHQEETDD